MTNFDELYLYTKGTNSLVTSELAPNGWFVVRLCTKGHHKTRNGWYLGLVVPVSSIAGLLILYS